MNAILLWLAGYSSDYWLTFNQARQLGLSVRKSEKASKIIFYKEQEVKKPDENGKTKSEKYILTKLYCVFNLLQTNYPFPKEDKQSSFINKSEIDSFVTNFGVKIVFGGDRAFYDKLNDMIRMPCKTKFISEENYYATLLHEIAHSTMAKHRLDRQTKIYATEELIAELSSAFLCSQFNLTGKLGHTAYIQSWLKSLKEDKKYIFKVVGQARQICDYLQQFKKENKQPIAA